MDKIEFHKIWIEQCEAAEGIKERFGVRDAARYLIGEKLLRFQEEAWENPEFASELPAFVSRIKEIFEPHELVEVLDDLQSGKVPDPSKLMNGRDPDDTEIDDFEVVHDAEKILLIETAKKLLLP